MGHWRGVYYDNRFELRCKGNCNKSNMQISRIAFLFFDLSNVIIDEWEREAGDMLHQHP